jgi:hypothetical protein
VRLPRSTAAVLFAALLAVTSPQPATAGFLGIAPGPDPVEIALLAKIIAACDKVYVVLHGINQRVEQFRNLQSLMFPQTALMQIETLFRNVASIKQEFENLACGWKFSPRIQALRLGLLRQGPLCRDEYENVFGRVLPSIDSDLKTMREWSSVRRMNSIASTIDASDQWSQAAAEYGSRARAANTSPGRALRYMAGLSALGLQQEVVAGKHEAELLSAAQEDLDAEMRKDWLDQNYAMNVAEWTGAAIDQLHKEGGLGAALVR